MRKLLLFLLILGISTSILAQQKGYILTDTAMVSGHIDILDDAQAAKTCQIQIDVRHGVETFTPEQIHGYGYIISDKESYEFLTFKVILENDTVKRFLCLISKGDLPVYYLKENTTNHFYILDENKNLIELERNDGAYKNQLANYYTSPLEVIPFIHNRFTSMGMAKTVKEIKEPGNTIVKYPFRISLHTGYTIQKLPLDLQVMSVYSNWNEFKAGSITYALAMDIPLLKYWPVSFHQEVSYNKFVYEYRAGPSPPDYQLIQDFSVLSLPSLIVYTFGKKKLTSFVNAGLQFDIALNKNNIGWLITSTIENTDPYTSGYLDYKTLQVGYAAGLGVTYAINQKFALSSEFRYSGIFNVLPGKAGTESQYTFRIGISYNFIK